MHRRPRSVRRSRRGQSLVEFAVILPLLLTLVGAAVDIARVYQAQITLEGATRDAAEYAATYETTSAAALASATARVCTQMASIPGRVGSPSDPSTCTQPAVAVSNFSVSTTATGASTKYPIGTVTVTSTFPFRPLFAYPLITQNGAWTITATETYSVIQGR
jgi:Flp pilus assembly protein TadG